MSPAQPEAIGGRTSLGKAPAAHHLRRPPSLKKGEESRGEGIEQARKDRGDKRKWPGPRERRLLRKKGYSFCTLFGFLSALAGFSFCSRDNDARVAVVAGIEDVSWTPRLVDGRGAVGHIALISRVVELRGAACHPATRLNRCPPSASRDACPVLIYSLPSSTGPPPRSLRSPRRRRAAGRPRPNRSYPVRYPGQSNHWLEQIRSYLVCCGRPRQHIHDHNAISCLLQNFCSISSSRFTRIRNRAEDQHARYSGHKMSYLLACSESLPKNNFTSSFAGTFQNRKQGIPRRRLFLRTVQKLRPVPAYRWPQCETNCSRCTRCSALRIRAQLIRTNSAWCQPTIRWRTQTTAIS